MVRLTPAESGWQLICNAQGSHRAKPKCRDKRIKEEGRRLERFTQSCVGLWRELWRKGLGSRSDLMQLIGGISGGGDECRIGT